MLHAVQAHFLPALQAAVTPASAVQPGPVATPVPSDSLPRVVVTATRLALVFEQGDDDPLASRGTAHFGGVHRWSGDGVARDFQVPDNQVGDIAELECPPGRPLRIGDDYAVDGRTVRLMRAAPPGQDNLVVRLRGGPARGYLDKRACIITLQIQIWSTALNKLDALSSRVHAALLAAAADLPHLEATPHDDLGVRVRLLRPHAAWISTTRDIIDAQPALLRDTLEFQLRGELEQRITLGQPGPAGIIEKIVYTADP